MAQLASPAQDPRNDARLARVATCGFPVFRVRTACALKNLGGIPEHCRRGNHSAVGSPNTTGEATSFATDLARCCEAVGHRPDRPRATGEAELPKATCLSRKRTNNRYWARHLYPTDREGKPALASPHKQSQQDASALVRARRMTNQTSALDSANPSTHGQAHRRQAHGESQVRRPTPRSSGPSPVVLSLQQRVPRPLAMGVYRVDGLAAWTPVSLRPFPYHHRLPSRCVVSEFAASAFLRRVVEAFPAQWVADGRQAIQATSLRFA